MVLKLQESETKILYEQKRNEIKKTRKNQIPYAILVLKFIIIFSFYLSIDQNNIVLFWLFGLAFGYVIQRSGFCFTAVFRDPYVSGVTSLTRAGLISIAVASAGFTAIKYSAYIYNAEQNLNMVGVAPIGFPLVVGAFLFGIGMVICGGCASGTFARIGEGFSLQVITLLFFILGVLIGANNNTLFWDRFNENAPRIFLPDIFGWFVAIVIQATIIVVLYIAAVKWQEKKLGTKE